MDRLKPPAFECHHIILDSITEGVFTVDLAWRITSFNKAAEQITGFSRDEAMGKACNQIFRASMCETGCVLREAIKKEVPIRKIPGYIIRNDGKQIPISVNATVLRDVDGQVLGGVETFCDLSTAHTLRKELQKRHKFADIISKNNAMLKIFQFLPHVAQSDSTVLILGTSGTGKELIARAIHNNGLRKDGPFIAVNCGALPDTLCESELFGYKAGAFTDAKKDKLGRFALAQDGTIFLDEIGDISKSAQVRLLRVLEQKTYEPLGATSSVKTNARVIAATNQDIEQKVKQGKFREDLFYRINVFKIFLPPLSQRKEDIPVLVDHFVERFNHLTGKHVVAVSPNAMTILLSQDWPGNIRELENAIEHAFVLCDGDVIQLRHLPQRIIPEEFSMIGPADFTLKEVEKHAIEKALERNRWKKMATARELGIDKNTLRRKIKRFRINPPE